MKLLYLDTMDLANLGDGKWGTALAEVARTLRDNDAILGLSWHHFHESVGVGVERAHARFMSLLDAGITAQVFAEDPAVIELRYFKAIVDDPDHEVPPSVPLVFHPLTEGVIVPWLADAAASRPELRDIHEHISRGEFFGTRAGRESRAMSLGELLVTIESWLPTVDLAALITKVQEVDFTATFDAAMQQRFLKKKGEAIADVVASQQPEIATLLASAADVPTRLRGMFAEYGIDADGGDRDMTLSAALELMRVRYYGLEHLDWRVPRSLMEFLVASRIPTTLDDARQQDPQRISEPGDFTDTAHAAYLPYVSVMTADKRTVAALRTCKNARITHHAQHLYPGGNPPNLQAALTALANTPHLDRPQGDGARG